MKTDSGLRKTRKKTFQWRIQNDRNFLFSIVKNPIEAFRKYGFSADETLMKQVQKICNNINIDIENELIKKKYMIKDELSNDRGLLSDLMIDTYSAAQKYGFDLNDRDIEYIDVFSESIAEKVINIFTEIGFTVDGEIIPAATNGCDACRACKACQACGISYLPAIGR